MYCTHAPLPVAKKSKRAADREIREGEQEAKLRALSLREMM